MVGLAVMGQGQNLALNVAEKEKGFLLKASQHQRLPTRARARPARVIMGMGLKHPHSPNDPFLVKLAAAASTEMGQAQLAGASGISDGPPLLDILTNPVMMAAPAQVRFDGLSLSLGFSCYGNLRWICK